MCNLPPEVRAALYGVGQQDDDVVPDAEKPVGAEEPVGHYLVHE